MDVSKILSGFHLENGSARSKYMQMAGIIGDKIAGHIIPPGTKLPPERELAVLFGVSRTTAINAYRHLERQGLVRTRVGSGTYVEDVSGAADTSVPGVPWRQLFASSPRFPLSSALRELLDIDMSKDSISLAAGMPDPALYPLDTFQRLMAGEKGGMQAADFGHLVTEGYGPLRRLVTGMLGQRDIRAEAGEVMITTGSQQGLYLLSKVLLEPGDYVVVEAPTFIGAHQVFRASGARVLSLPATGSFPFDLLGDYLVRYRPKLLYLIPTFHNPTGRVMPGQERRELMKLAARYRLVIVEDDPYSELYYDEPPPLSLKAMDSYGGVVYLGTFSKILCPGLRTGFVAAHPILINKMALEKQYIDLHSNNLAQWLIRRLLESEDLSAHLSLVRREYKKRRDVLAKALLRHCGDKLEFSIPKGGFYLWCGIGPNLSAARLLHETSKSGLSFVPGQAFYTTGDGEREMRLCFATHPEHVLQEAARRLARTISGAVKEAGEEESPPQTAVRPII